MAATALSRDRDAVGASRELELAADQLPGDSEILSLLAASYVERAMFKEAHDVLERIRVHSDRGLLEKLFYIGFTLERAGQLSEAIEEYDAAHRALPSDPRPLDALARIAGRLGRHDEEINYLQQAEALPGVDRAAYEARIAEVRRLIETSTSGQSQQ